MGSRIDSVQWVAWIGATAVAALTMAGYVFAQFETKQDALDRRAQLKAEIAVVDVRTDKRLERIEQKIDDLIIKVGNRR